MNIYIASSKRSPKPLKDGSRSQTVFFTVALCDNNVFREVELFNGSGSDEEFYYGRASHGVSLYVSGWCLRDGLIRPPSMPGRSRSNFFPHLFAPALDSPLLSELYSIVGPMADYYNVPLAPRDEALTPCIMNHWHLANLKGLQNA